VWLWTEFGLVIGFTEHLQNITTNNYDSLTELHTPKITVTTAHLKSSHSSLTVVRQRLPKANVPLPLRSRSVAGLSYQLLTTAHNDWTATVLSLTHSLTNQLLNWLNWLTEPLTNVLLITSRHGPHSKHHSSVAVYWPLPSNSRCLVVCFEVVA
jgi:hypothetical protein